MVEENERLDKLAKWNLEQASMLAEDYKKTKAENQKLREAIQLTLDEWEYNLSSAIAHRDLPDEVAILTKIVASLKAITKAKNV